MKRYDQSAKLLKLRRQYKELADIKISQFSAAMKQAEYENWCADVREKIAAINRRNK